MRGGAYAAVLRVPGAAAFCAAATLARLPMAMLALGSVLLVTGLGRSFTLAGLVAGAYAVSQAVGSPYLGRLTDRLGQTRVLAPQTAVHVTLLVLLVTAARAGAAGALLVGLGAAIGLTMPQVGALSRARWTRLLDGDPWLETALALEAVVEEAVFVAGPAMVAVAVAASGPTGGLLLAAALTVAGVGLFLAQRRTEPAPVPAAADGVPHRSALRSPALVVLVVVFACMGAFFGFVEVAVAGLAAADGRPGAAGVVLALWTTGSLVAGLVYGARRWATPMPVRFAASAVWLAVGAVAVAGVAGLGLIALTGCLVVAGSANALVIVTGNTLVPDVVLAAATTEAYTWLMVVIFAGSAVGTSVGGAVVDGPGGAAALWCAVAAAALTAAAALVGRRRLVPGGSTSRRG